MQCLNAERVKRQEDEVMRVILLKYVYKIFHYFLSSEKVEMQPYLQRRATLFLIWSVGLGDQKKI